MPRHVILFALQFVLLYHAILLRASSSLFVHLLHMVTLSFLPFRNDKTLNILHPEGQNNNSYSYMSALTHTTKHTCTRNLYKTTRGESPNQSNQIHYLPDCLKAGSHLFCLHRVVIGSAYEMIWTHVHNTGNELFFIPVSQHTSKSFHMYFRSQCHTSKKDVNQP